MKYDLSILMPAKRVANWEGVYHSIAKSFHGKWELIIVTSHDLPSELRYKDNIKLIYNNRSPMAKQQLGLCRAEGEYITAISDDTLYEPWFLDESFKILKDKDYKFYLVLKYVEGENTKLPIESLIDLPNYQMSWDFMMSDEYYYLKLHNTSNFKYVPYSAHIISNAIISRQVLWELGGWDCVFNVVPMANNDLNIRMIKYGCRGTIQDGMSQKCDWIHGKKGDHSAVHRAQVKHDEPLFKDMYDKDGTHWGPGRMIIPLDNWKNTEEEWSWRHEENIPERV